MIVIIDQGASDHQIARVEQVLKDRGYQVHRSDGSQQTVLGAVGSPESPVDPRDLEMLEGVREVHRVQRSFKLVDRACQPEGSVIDVAGVRIGGDEFTVIAGPCAVESREQMLRAAREVKSGGAHILRGGAFKPRTGPYSFQGLEDEGLKYLREAGDSQKLPVVTEVIDAKDVDLVGRHADMLQVGARAMQNFRLLTALGKSSKPVLLKRGMAATLEEFLLAAEYIVANGNPRVVLCERGVRTFEPWTRNTLDLSAIPVLKKLTHLPILVDPSHATGVRDYVAPMARAAAAAGADGIIIEVHPEPDQALCDGAQSLDAEQFGALMADLRIIAPAVHRRMSVAPRSLTRTLESPLFERAVLIGVGLMGGSLALALREINAVGTLVGVDVASERAAIESAGVVDKFFTVEEMAEALDGADLVVLASPVESIVETIGKIAPLLKPGALLTDLGSTKQAICKAAERLAGKVAFVGGHPMAGSERRGAAHANPLLFQDAAWALCPVGDIPSQILDSWRSIIERIGAHPFDLDAQRHDHLAAAVSHVPHLVAVALANSVGRLGEQDPMAGQLAASGFRDVTRTASSPYRLWRGILGSNQDAISQRLKAFRQALDEIEAALGSDERLDQELSEAARHRLGMRQDGLGLLQAEAEIIVRVEDRPGALSLITTALAHAQINIRDIQILKVRQDEDGVLRLAFADRGLAQQAAEVLRAAGQEVRVPG